METTTSYPKPFGAANGGHPNYKTNEARVTGHAKRHGVEVGAEACCYCGKGVKGRPRFTVFLTAVGEMVAKDTTKATEAELSAEFSDYLGHYPVGPDCAKKLKAAGVTVYDGLQGLS